MLQWDFWHQNGISVSQLRSVWEILFPLFPCCCHLDLDLPCLVCRGSWVIKSFNLRLKEGSDEKISIWKIIYLVRFKKRSIHSLSETCKSTKSHKSTFQPSKMSRGSAMSCCFAALSECRVLGKSITGGSVIRIVLAHSKLYRLGKK